MDGHVGELFHTGIVVDDLDEAMALLTRIAGLTWAAPQTVGGFIATPKGALYRKLKVTYSVEGPHRVELIQHLDSTAWDNVTGGHRVHHLGLWTDDLRAGMERMAALGLEAEAHGLDQDGRPVGPSFHRHAASGMWIELLETSYREAMEEWWTGAELRLQ
jgi:hypothetical protein